MKNFSIHPNTSLGAVSLTVTNLEQSMDFYRQSLGFQVHRQENGAAYLGAGRDDLLVLMENPQAQQVFDTTGLYHFAVLVPSRFELARSLQRISQTKTPVTGFSDHLVSEAIYLSDPDGNGIEIYRDRPRNEWQFENGALKMAVDPLDIEDLISELTGHSEPWPGLHVDTVLGHMHLHVANIAQAEAFYNGVLGFDIMTRYGRQASFLSAGGYHHHLGINTWAGEGAPPPPDNAVGLNWWTVRLPDNDALDAVLDRVKQAGIDIEERDTGIYLQDPSQNGLILIT